MKKLLSLTVLAAAIFTLASSCKKENTFQQHAPMTETTNREDTPYIKPSLLLADTPYITGQSAQIGDTPYINTTKLNPADTPYLTNPQQGDTPYIRK